MSNLNEVEPESKTEKEEISVATSEIPETPEISEPPKKRKRRGRSPEEMALMREKAYAARMEKKKWKEKSKEDELTKNLEEKIRKVFGGEIEDIKKTLQENTGRWKNYSEKKNKKREAIKYAKAQIENEKLARIARLKKEKEERDMRKYLAKEEEYLSDQSEDYTYKTGGDNELFRLMYG